MSNSTDGVTKALFILVSALVLVAVVNNFYIFYYQKNYNFIVEVSCDTTEQSCFIRDCNDGECPPNELEQYRMFSLNAKDFSLCETDSCLRACLSGQITCSEILCGESEEDTCSTVPIR